MRPAYMPCRHKEVTISDAAETFDAALSCAVQIVERGKILEPSLSIEPQWVFDPVLDDQRLVFTVEVTSLTHIEDPADA